MNGEYFIQKILKFIKNEESSLKIIDKSNSK